MLALSLLANHLLLHFNFSLDLLTEIFVVFYHDFDLLNLRTLLNLVKHLHDVLSNAAGLWPKALVLFFATEDADGRVHSIHLSQDMHYFVNGDGNVLDLGLFLIFCIDFDFVDIKILRIILSEKLWEQILFEL